MQKQNHERAGKAILEPQKELWEATAQMDCVASVGSNDGKLHLGKDKPVFTVTTTNDTVCKAGKGQNKPNSRKDVEPGSNEHEGR